MAQVKVSSQKYPYYNPAGDTPAGIVKRYIDDNGYVNVPKIINDVLDDTQLKIVLKAISGYKVLEKYKGALEQLEDRLRPVNVTSKSNLDEIEATPVVLKSKSNQRLALNLCAYYAFVAWFLNQRSEHKSNVKSCVVEVHGANLLISANVSGINGRPFLSGHSAEAITSDIADSITSTVANRIHFNKFGDVTLAEQVVIHYAGKTYSFKRSHNTYDPLGVFTLKGVVSASDLSKCIEAFAAKGAVPLINKDQTLSKKVSKPIVVPIARVEYSDLEVEEEFKETIVEKSEDPFLVEEVAKTETPGEFREAEDVEEVQESEEIEEHIQMVDSLAKVNLPGGIVPLPWNQYPYVAVVTTAVSMMSTLPVSDNNEVTSYLAGCYAGLFKHCKQVLNRIGVDFIVNFDDYSCIWTAESEAALKKLSALAVSKDIDSYWIKPKESTSFREGVIALLTNSKTVLKSNNPVMLNYHNIRPYIGDNFVIKAVRWPSDQLQRVHSLFKVGKRVSASEWVPEYDALALYIAHLRSIITDKKYLAFCSIQTEALNVAKSLYKRCLRYNNFALPDYFYLYGVDGDRELILKPTSNPTSITLVTKEGKFAANFNGRTNLIIDGGKSYYYTEVDLTADDLRGGKTLVHGYSTELKTEPKSDYFAGSVYAAVNNAMQNSETLSKTVANVNLNGVYEMLTGMASSSTIKVSEETKQIVDKTNVPLLFKL